MTPARFKSTFYSSILFHARCAPQSVAVAFGNQEVSYGEFVRDIERATRQIAARMRTGGGLALVSIAHPYLHIVVTIALGRAGITSVSAFDPIRSGALERIQPDAVLADPGTTGGDGRFIMVTEAWIGLEAEQLPPFIEREHEADAPLRLVLSSGTTGIPKKILLTHGLFQHRLNGSALGGLFTGKQSRTLALVGVDTAGGHLLPMATWFIGGRVVLLLQGEDPYQTIARKGVNYVFLAPVQLEQILRAMPASAWPLPGLTVSVGGSSLPQRLAQQARARLSPNVVTVYGSTEAGLLTFAHTVLAESVPGMTGVVRPEVDVQIVDPAGNPLPHGEVGEVRCRSLDCVPGYLDAGTGGADNEETFRDGWFYPGDAGKLSSDGVLSIVGRTRELMNLGGVKMSPNAIEDALRNCAGVMDIAAFALERDAGVATPWVAVVQGPGYDQAALAQAFQQAFPRLPTLKVAHADRIPRNQMGKIQRKLIEEQVRRSLEGAR